MVQDAVQEVNESCNAYFCLYVKLKAMRDFTEGNFWSHLCIMIGYLILNGLTGFRETIQDAVLRKNIGGLDHRSSTGKRELGYGFETHLGQKKPGL